MKKLRARHPRSVNAEAFETAVRAAAPSAVLVDAILLTSEICGQMLSPAAARILAGDLADFDEAVILAALARCRIEIHGRLKVSDIIVRIVDGRPDMQEAWNMLPMDEAASTVWTEEMARAWGHALPALEAGDVAAAHAAFAESYARAVHQARLRRDPVRWLPSLGSDVKGREGVVRDALSKGRLTLTQASALLPPGGLATPAANDAPLRRRKLH
ncbi:MAG: hypothetical protein ABWY05_12490 [Noviherbaspirillum sp.]